MTPQHIPPPPPAPDLPWLALTKPQPVLSVCQPPPGSTCPKAAVLVEALELNAGRLGVGGLTIGRAKAACAGACADGPFVALPRRSMFLHNVTEDWVEPLITETLLRNRLLFPLLAIDPLKTIHPRLLFDRQAGVLAVMDEGACMVQVARYFLGFHEGVSCGKCVPCRIGVIRLTEIIDDIIVGAATEKHIELIEQVSKDMTASAYCQFASKASGPVLLIVKHYQEEFLTHIRERLCPARVCPLHF